MVQYSASPGRKRERLLAIDHEHSLNGAVDVRFWFTRSFSVALLFDVGSFTTT